MKKRQQRQQVSKTALGIAKIVTGWLFHLHGSLIGKRDHVGRVIGRGVRLVGYHQHARARKSALARQLHTRPRTHTHTRVTKR
jgi:hypothetical protein